jgi:hypothetical protein
MRSIRATDGWELPAVRLAAIAARQQLRSTNRTMDISGIGAGPRATDFSGPLRAVLETAGLKSTPQSAGDIFVSGLQELSEAEMTTLLNMIERPESPQQAGRLDDLLRAAVAATAEGDHNLAMGSLAEFALMSPRRAETLGSLPSLSSMRGPIEQLVRRLNVTAKGEAEAQLARAVKLMGSVDAKELVVREFRAENLILMAGRLLDAGGYANFVWSAELSQLVVDPRLWAANAVPLPRQVNDADADDRRPAAGNGIFVAISGAIGRVRAGLQLKSRTLRLWSRAPLLVLLLAWFAVGLAGGLFSALVRNYWPGVLSASDVDDSFVLWALGFLALVVVGFYVRVRNVRF